ncbi:ABC-2 type transport system permease protein [Chitinophaga dinghuensis]|uniref:ABC-2 type transport system permease protein n=1 Tax=Chitinophaga dinghuensis TaxID=1539050 RepID=A0A327VW90_9BACT|nr:ABC transporter permease [Chitinophaga dinghuensis]RAJ80271.1 ABC-2 type transport system permease protein [Chitinophaga dinghuensis]
METRIPATKNVLTTLLQADFTTLWRNRRSLRLVLLVPIIILISWKGLVDKLGPVMVLSSVITIGLTSIGLMGYSNTMARDRDRGVFQRLRVAPVPTWTIMLSRLSIQIGLIALMVLLVFIVGFAVDKISISALGYITGLLMTIVAGWLYLGLGQLIVGLIKNPDTVNSTTRLVYFAFIMVGMFGQFGALGETMKEVVQWSPYGVVQKALAGSLQPLLWTNDHTMALLATIGYTLVFVGLGIKYFKWDNK